MKNKHSDTNTFAAEIKALYDKYFTLQQGETTDILEHLQDADPSSFAVSAVSVEGMEYSAGDSSTFFPIQSISKPFVYGMALEDRGEEYVRKVIGVEPTGEAFDSFIGHSEVLEGRFNPMVNVGAVTTTSLIKGKNLEERIKRLKKLFADYTGHPVEFDQIALSGRKTLDYMNKSIAYLMLSEGCLEGNVDETVQLFGYQCSILADTRDCAMMAATLANGGLHPVTGIRVLSPHYVKNVLSIMFMSGMYDFSGQWAYRVGIPAKSGLAGAVLAVVPGRLGIAAYSPLLGPHSKSVRGVRVLEELSGSYDFHMFRRAAESKLPEKTETILNDRVRFTELLKDIHTRYRDLDDGRIYTAEPDLYESDRNTFGICVTRADGSVFEVGDSRHDFFIQSVSKLFTYGLALEDHGREEVLKRVDVEPTGDAYNAIIEVEKTSKRPYNPMVNAGGLAISSLIKGGKPAIRLNRILEMYQRYIGRQVYIDAPAFIAEQDANDRNWAILYMLKNFGMVEGNVKETMNLYLQQCSAVVNCRDLAMMGATLANEGINPVTGVSALRSDYIRDLLTVMYTCGMYDYAGEWAYEVGIPAKSGVSGCILGVVPGQLGISVYSPPLDHRGNSVRGIKVFEELSRELELHIFHPKE